MKGRLTHRVNKKVLTMGNREEWGRVKKNNNIKRNNKGVRKFTERGDRLY